MDFEEVLKRRRMVRRYAPEPVARERVDRILDAACRAPSAGFAQGQSFVVVTDSDRRKQIARIAGEPGYVERGFDAWLSTAPVHVIVCVSEQAYRRRYREPDKMRAGRPREWPVPYWYVDGGASLMLLLLGAVNEGLAAGFVDLEEHGYAELKELLGIPPEVEPIGLVTIGVPAPDRRSGSLKRGHRPKQEVVHRERWGSGSTPGGGPG
ncbi:MAG: nitroreductase family protein [Actinomycetota bacterium]